jgi:hypothetical protein
MTKALSERSGTKQKLTCDGLLKKGVLQQSLMVSEVGFATA